MTKLARNALVYVSSNIAAAGVPFLLLPLLTRVLAPEEYGAIAMFMALLAVLGAATGLSVHGAVNVRYFESEAADFPRFVGTCLLIVGASSSLTFLVAWWFRAPLSEFVSLPSQWILGAVLVSALNSVIQVRLSLWLVREQPVTYGVFQFARAALDALLSLYLVLVLLQGFEGRLWGRAGATLLFGAVALTTMLLARQASFRPDRAHAREALAFGIPLIPHVIGTFLIAAGDRFIINALLGLEEAGVYMVAIQLGMAMQLVTEGINRAFVPWLYRELQNADPLALRRIVAATWLYFALAVLAAGIITVLAEWIVGIVAGDAYVEAAAVLGWIALGQAFHGMYLMVTNYTFFTRKTAQLSAITLLSGVTALTLTCLLVPEMGVAGGGLSFAIAMLLKFLLTWSLAQRVYPMPWLLKKSA